ELKNRVIDNSLDQSPITPLALQKIFVCGLPVRNVPRHLSEPDEFTGLVANGIYYNEGPEPTTILAHAPALSVKASCLAGGLKGLSRKSVGPVFRGVEN